MGMTKIAEMLKCLKDTGISPETYLAVKKEYDEMKARGETMKMTDVGDSACCETAQPPGWIDIMKEIKREMEESIALSEEITGPKNMDESVGKEPECLRDSMGSQIWQLGALASVLLDQIKRIHREF